MLVPEFWHWFGWILAGLCVMGVITAWFLGQVIGLGREDDDE